MVKSADPADVELRAYLNQTLGIDAKVRPWGAAPKLPYFLQDAFELRELGILDQWVVLATNRRKTNPSPKTIRSQLAKLKQVANSPIVYVTSALASYERRRLIEQKVPFIVPGNQLYLPELGIDLREYFRQPAAPADSKLSPATQALLITALLRTPWTPDWQPADRIVELGYTAMTLSRATKELTATGLASAQRHGRATQLRMNGTAAAIWEQAKPLLRSPVKKIAWVRAAKVSRLPLAGLSALARYSQLVEPAVPTYAVTAAQWKAAADAGLEELPESLEGSHQWQLWSYAPLLGARRETVDPLSLTLSLREETDERIQIALDELRERFPW